MSQACNAPIERRSVTSRYHGSKISGSQQLRGFCNSKKAIGFDWQKSNFARPSRFFVHFLAVVARLRLITSNFTRPLYRVGEHNTKFSFFFL